MTLNGVVLRASSWEEGTVKSRLYKGRKELKSMLAPDEEPHEGKERKVPQHA